MNLNQIDTHLNPEMPQAAIQEAQNASFGAQRPEPIVSFYLQPKLDVEKTKALGRPIYIDKPYLLVQVPDDPGNSVSHAVEPEHTKRFVKQWLRFAALVRSPKHSLRVLPRITPSVVRMLEEEPFNLRCVEDLALCESLPEDLALYGELARAYLSLLEFAIDAGKLPEPSASSTRVVPIEIQEVDDAETDLLLKGEQIIPELPEAASAKPRLKLVAGKFVPATTEDAA